MARAANRVSAEGRSGDSSPPARTRGSRLPYRFPRSRLLCPDTGRRYGTRSRSKDRPAFRSVCPQFESHALVRSIAHPTRGSVDHGELSHRRATPEQAVFRSLSGRYAPGCDVHETRSPFYRFAPLLVRRHQGLRKTGSSRPPLVSPGYPRETPVRWPPVSRSVKSGRIPGLPTGSFVGCYAADVL